MSYEIRETPHGLLVFGSMPIDEMAALSKLWEKKGYKYLAPGIAQAFGAMLAVTGDVKAWQKVVEAEVAARHPEDPELQWLRGTDTGTSSQTIFSVLCRPDLRHAAVAGRFRPDVPSDPSDFGRCYRLVREFKWRDRLPEVAKVHPSWAPIVERWDTMAEHYAYATRPGVHKTAKEENLTCLYDLLKECRGVK